MFNKVKSFLKSLFKLENELEKDGIKLVEELQNFENEVARIFKSKKAKVKKAPAKKKAAPKKGKKDAKKDSKKKN